MQGKTISQACGKYMVHLESVDKSANTIDNYRRRLTKFISWLGDKEFCLDTVDEYRAYLKPLAKTPTIHLELRIIRTFITYLSKRKYFSENWGENIELPKIKKLVEFVPTQEQAIDAILLGTEPGEGDNNLSRKRKSVTRNALRFIVLTGIRQCELHKLRVKDIDLATTEFKIQSKGGDEDKLPFRRALTEILEEAITNKKPNDLVFKCTKKHLNSCLKDGCKKLGIKTITAHKLRKVFGTDLARKNVNPFIIGRLLRHKDIRVTYENYIRNNIEDLKLTVNSTQE